MTFGMTYVQAISVVMFSTWWWSNGLTEICCTYLLAYLLYGVALEKLTGFQPVKKFPAFHGTQRFVTVFTSAGHLSLSWASSIQSIPLHLTSWRSVLILSSHICLGLPSGLFPSGFPTKTLYTPLLSPVHSTWPTHHILLDFITKKILGEEYRLLSSSLCGFLHSPVTSSLLANLKSNGNRTSYFKPFLIGNMSGKFLPTWTLLYVSVRHILIILAGFMGIPNSMRIVYKTSLLIES